jgi:hypothetical protein
MCKQHLLVLRIAEDYQHLHAHPHNKHTDKKVTLPNLSLLQDNITAAVCIIAMQRLGQPISKKEKNKTTLHSVYYLSFISR